MCLPLLFCTMVCRHTLSVRENIKEGTPNTLSGCRNITLGTVHRKMGCRNTRSGWLNMLSEGITRGSVATTYCRDGVTQHFSEKTVFFVKKTSSPAFSEPACADASVGRGEGALLLLFGSAEC